MMFFTFKELFEGLIAGMRIEDERVLYSPSASEMAHMPLED